VFDSIAAALDAARASADETDLIVVTGSLYTVADAHRALGEPF
jgi:folylpolyglutamate synthase/dihydropteroate synthase